MDGTHKHPLAHNCNCFCKQLARFLGLSVPPWVNRAARWAAPFAPLLVVEVGVETWNTRRQGRRSSPPPHPFGSVSVWAL